MARLPTWGEDFFSGTWDSFDVDFFVGDGVLIEEAFCLAAVAAPGRGVEKEFHASIFADPAEIIEFDTTFAGMARLIFVPSLTGRSWRTAI